MDPDAEELLIKQTASAVYVGKFEHQYFEMPLISL